MKGVFHILRYLLLFVGSISIWASCVRESCITPQTGEDVFVKILFNTPDLRPPDQKYGTRAMSPQAERTIDIDLLSVLVFRHDDQGGGNTEEIFFYKAPITGSIVYLEEDQTKAVVTAKLIKGILPDDRFRIVIIANHDISGVVMTPDVTTKAEVLDQLRFSLPGKWDADSESYTDFPMWGETQPVSISESTQSQTIDLYRAVAKVDIGLNFSTFNGTISEDAVGIPEFKLKEILIYRTYDKGFVAPVDNNFLSTASIPPDAVRHEDDDPIIYTLTDLMGSDSFVREIYLPEADLPMSPNNNNIHNIVIGGYYNQSPVITYYRLDFAAEVSPAQRIYLPILRNHRYVFNITQVRGPGFDSADEALRSVGTIRNFDYDLIAWDETTHRMEVEGKYYFGLDNREVFFGARATADDPVNIFSVSYRTNYPLSPVSPLKLEWKSAVSNPLSPPAFRAEWIESSGNIRISALTTNETNAPLTDTLIVRAGPFAMEIPVRQDYINFSYSLVCSTVTLSGVYARGKTLNPAEHYIMLSIVATDRGLQGYPYIIETTDLLNHGISFRVEGVFDFSGIPQGNPLRIDNIKLTGSGTLSAAQDEKTLSLTIISNSSSGSSCEVTIPLVIARMNILVLSDINNAFGYAISRLTGGAGQVFNSPNNFGTANSSIVNVEGFTYISSTTYDFAGSTSSTAYRWVTGTGNDGQIADIVYIAYPAVFGNATAALLAAYMDKGGVLVAFIESTDTSRHLANNLFGRSDIAASALGRGGSIYPFPGHTTFGLSNETREEVMRQYEGDPILNGPFGDVRDKQWGADAGATVALNLTDIPESRNLARYSYYRDISVSSPTTQDVVNCFKYESESRNMVWFGDGGVMSSGYSGSTGIPLPDNLICPFYWNTTNLFPIAKPTYGWSTVKWPVYNSTAFCNIMAWAIARSESLRAKRGN